MRRLQRRSVSHLFENYTAVEILTEGKSANLVKNTYWDLLNQTNADSRTDNLGLDNLFGENTRNLTIITNVSNISFDDVSLGYSDHFSIKLAAAQLPGPMREKIRRELGVY